MNNPVVIYGIIFGSMCAFGGVGVLAFYWAAKHGQMKNLEDGSKVIFDEDENIGKVTDAFPPSHSKKQPLSHH